MTAGDGSVVIRDALASDAPTLSFLLGQLGFPCPTGEIVGRLQGMPGAALVAVRDGQVVGLVTTNIMPVLHRPTPVGRLSALIVTTQERRRGVGRALVAAAERMLKKQGCELVEVTSNLRLEDAHSFYQRLGYEVTSLRFRKALDGTPQDAPAHEPPARPVG